MQRLCSASGDRAHFDMKYCGILISQDHVPGSGSHVYDYSLFQQTAVYKLWLINITEYS